MDTLTSGRPTIYQYLWQVYHRIAPFVFGALISQMTTDIAKYSIGRLRPHFIDVCHPRWEDTGIILVRSTACPANAEDIYIESYTCTNTDFTEDRIRDSHLSFMSGHSSFSAFCLVYLVVSPQTSPQLH